MNRILAAALPAIALSAPFVPHAAPCDITTNPVSPSGINAPGSLTLSPGLSLSRGPHGFKVAQRHSKCGEWLTWNGAGKGRRVSETRHNVKIDGVVRGIL